MEDRHFLLLLLTTSLVQCFHVEDGCEVKSEWKIDYEWPDMYLSAWVAPDIQDILTIEVSFVGHFTPITYDNIVISRSEIQTERIREGRPSSVTNQTHFNVADGWVELSLTLNSNYSLMYDGKAITVGAVEFLPSYLIIKGSNVTVNCQSDMRVWKLDKNPSSVPLDESLEHRLSFYSSRKFSPALSLEMRDIAFGWDNGALTTIPSKAQPLPPFQEHELTITCLKEEELICRLLIGKEKRTAEDMRVGDLPKTVTIQGRTDENFYLILHKSHSLTTEANASQPHDGTSPANESCFALTVGINISIVIVAVVILLVCIVIRKWRQDQERVKARETHKGNYDIEAATENKDLLLSINSSSKDTATEYKDLRSSDSSSEDSGVYDTSSESSQEDGGNVKNQGHISA